MISRLIAALAFVPLGLAVVVSAQAPGALSTVRIPQPVTANGRPLAPGTYEVRLTADRPALPSGAPSSTQRWVDILAGGTIVAREIAELAVPDPSAHPPSSAGNTQAVAQLLKEGDFVRVSVWEAGERYLIYLPTGAAAAQPGAPSTSGAAVTPR
jgi:hypothetical protein